MSRAEGTDKLAAHNDLMLRATSQLVGAAGFFRDESGHVIMGARLRQRTGFGPYQDGILTLSSIDPDGFGQTLGQVWDDIDAPESLIYALNYAGARIIYDPSEYPGSAFDETPAPYDRALDHVGPSDLALIFTPSHPPPQK